MSARPPLSEAKRRVLELLKRLGAATAGEIADRLSLTDVAVRQHLSALETTGLVTARTQKPVGRGRPSILWSLTEQAGSVFPDRHGELTVGLIEAIRESVGEAGLLRIVEVRARDQLNLYRSVMPGADVSLKKRVEWLARRRTEEGYMAEVVQERPGEYLLIEHHCPICEAARACTGLCNAELSVFRDALGPDVSVERTKHLLSDGDRCAYRISKKARRHEGTQARRVRRPRTGNAGSRPT